VTALTGDVLDGELVRGAAEGCDGVFHCAGAVSRDPGDAELLWRSHVLGTRTALAACRDAGVARAVLASTSGTVAVSEDGRRVSREDDPPPLSLIQRFPYYRAKLYAEREALALATEAFRVVSVNPSLLLGPGDVYGSSTGDVRLFLERRVPAVPSGGLSFVDARDAAEALVLAMERGARGRRYLLGAANMTVREFFGKLSRVSGVDAPWVGLPRSVAVARGGARLLGRVAEYLGRDAGVTPESAELGQLYWYVDPARAMRELGWTHRDPMTTLADTVRDLRAQA
jgi:dihydroflavonol-4-reductase